MVSNRPHEAAGMYATPTGSPSPLGFRSEQRSLDRFSFPSSSTDSLDQHLLDTSQKRGIMDTTQGRGIRGRSITDYGTPQLSLSRPRGRGKPRPMSASGSFSGGFNEEERFSVGISHRRGVTGQVKGFASRPEPDGQSDISSTSPDLVLRRSQRGSVSSSLHSALSPPPSTPVPPDEDLTTPLTPDVLQSALTALEGIPDKATPLSLTPHQHSTEYSQGVLPEAVTSALTKWISSQSLHTSGVPSHSSSKATPLLTPPPSTPIRSHNSFDQASEAGGVAGGMAERQGISAGDLIAALSSLMVSSEDKGAGSRGSGGRGYSVPAGTPNEGVGPEGIEGWAKLGIRPEEVIQALSALTIQQVCVSVRVNMCQYVSVRACICQ